MRRKYFVRGMGVGIIITVLIFTVVMLVRGDSISNEDIIARAKTLGMVEGGSATIAQENEDKKDGTKTESDSSEKVDNVKTETKSGDDVDPTPGYTKPSENNDIKTNTDETKPATTVNTTTNRDETKPQAGNDVTNTGSGNKVKIVINSGDSSRIVSGKLLDLGLIEDSKAFDSFLMDGGYDHYLHVGEYEIDKGSDFESIAKSLTGR